MKLSELLPFEINEKLEFYNSNQKLQIENIYNTLIIVNKEVLGNRKKFFKNEKKNFIGLILLIIPPIITNYISNYISVKENIYEIIKKINDINLINLIFYFHIFFILIYIFLSFAINDKLKNQIYIMNTYLKFNIDNLQNSIIYFSKTEEIYCLKLNILQKKFYKFFYSYYFYNEKIIKKDYDLECQLDNIFINLTRLNLRYNEYFFNLYKLSDFLDKNNNNYNKFLEKIKLLSNLELFSIYLKINDVKKIKFYKIIEKISFLIAFIDVILILIVSIYSLFSNIKTQPQLYLYTISLILIFFRINLVINEKIRSREIHLKVQYLLEKEIENIFEIRKVEYKKYLDK